MSGLRVNQELRDRATVACSSLTVRSTPAFTGIVKRTFRIAWVLAANGGVACLMFIRLQSTGFYGGALDPQLLIEILFEIILPVVGIVLELANWKFARWVNVGCFAGAGCFWLVAAVWWRSDPFFGVLLIIAFGLLTVSGITEIVYRKTSNDSSDTA
jgi:hypothetical protein